MTTQFRINYVISRRLDGESDFTEIGFGSSGAWPDVGQCAYAVESAIQHQEWETSAGMPDPESVRPDQEAS